MARWHAPDWSRLRRLTREMPDSAISMKGVRPWHSAHETPSNSSASRLARSSCTHIPTALVQGKIILNAAGHTPPEFVQEKSILSPVPDCCTHTTKGVIQGKGLVLKCSTGQRLLHLSV